MKLDHLQCSFEFGETSPRVHQRVDLTAYSKSVKTMRNAYPFIQGGATKRPGTVFVGEASDSNLIVRLIPFTFSQSQSFMLVFNGSTIQFIKDTSFIESSPGVRYQLTSPYAHFVVPEIRYAQSGNTLYLTHTNYPPKIIQRITDTHWTIQDIPFTYNAVSDVTFSNGYITFKIINGGAVFVKDQQFTITTTAGIILATSAITGGTGTVGNGGVAAVGSQPGSTTSETWTVKCVMSTPSRQEWSVVGSVSGSPAAYWRPNDYPRCVSFFEQRLYFGGSPQFPQHIWASAAGDYLNLTVGNRDADGVIMQIAGNDYNGINHLVSSRQLLALTSSTEFSVSGANNTAISGISSNVIKDHTRNGSNSMRPFRIGKEIIFLQRDGRKVRAISYSVTEDANVAPDLTLFSEHMLRHYTGAATSFVDGCFSTNPDFIAWFVTGGGLLHSMTLNREQDMIAWAGHDTEGRDAAFENVASIPADDYDNTFVCVRRNIYGLIHRYIEVLDYSVGGAFVDSAAFYEGVPATTLTGLNHLLGKTVSIVADGVVHPDRVVSPAGSIELERSASSVVVGLPYTTTIELLHPEFGDATSSSTAKKFHVTDILVNFHETVNAKVNGIVIPFRTTTMGFDSVIPKFTGTKSVMSAGWRGAQDTQNIVLTSETPTPFTVLGVTLKAAVN